MSSNFDEQYRALSYFTMGEKFLNLAHLSATELVKGGNQHGLISDKPISHEMIYEHTKWSDLEISIPILFNFYHGLELMLKGMIAVKQDIKPSHKFSVLIDQAKSIYREMELIEKFELYTVKLDEQSIMSKFLKDNEIDIDSWYEALKYPYSRNDKPIVHKELKYGGVRTITFWSEVAKSSKEIVRLAVDLYDEFTQTSVEI